MIKLNIPQDKLLHFTTGLFGGAIIYLLIHSLLLSLCFGIIIGSLKELWDWNSNRVNIKAGRPIIHSVEFLDALSTVLGVLIGSLIARSLH